MRSVTGITVVFLSIIVLGCHNIDFVQTEKKQCFELAWQKTLDASLIIKKNEISSEFNNEFNRGEGSNRLNNLSLIIANNNYSDSEKTELIVKSLERGILYNLLAFNYSKRSEIIDSFAKRELKRELHKSLYSYNFYYKLFKELKQRNLLSEELAKKINSELDRFNLMYISLTNEDGKFVGETFSFSDGKFYELPENLLEKTLDNHIAFSGAYNHDYIKIAMRVVEQLPPYGSHFETALKFNEILFKAPKTLYENYSNELFIQSDCSLIFGVIGINYELELIEHNLKQIELAYAIKNNEYILAEKNLSPDRGEKFLELKKLELARFNAFLFLQYLLADKVLNKKTTTQNIPDNVCFVLEKTVLDIVKDNFK